MVHPPIPTDNPAVKTPAARRSKNGPRSVLKNLDRFVLAALLGFICLFLPLELFKATPPTGGDLGSHLWPVYNLIHFGFPNGTLRLWNPGNLAGEPQLLHYFPLPFLIIASIALVTGGGIALKFGVVLPALLLPLTAFYSVRRFGVPAPGPALAAILTLPFLFNESYYMWGGNIYSSLAGQFAHLWALNFFLLAIGCLKHDLLRQQTRNWSAAVWLAAIVVSHAYAAIGIPALVLGLFLTGGPASLSLRFRICGGACLKAMLLSAWFVIPLIDNQRWTTPYYLSWQSKSLIQEFLPLIMLPTVYLGIAGLAVLLLCGRGRRIHNRTGEFFAVWVLISIFFGGCYFAFPFIGLVDIRALPQIMLGISVAGGAVIGCALRMLSPRSVWLSPVLALAATIWTDQNVDQLEHQIARDFKGWELQPAYQEFSQLTGFLHGDFSMPRVVYQHDPRNHQAGSVRAFEMLPYFSRRATLESVYLQATIVAPAAFLIQADVSQYPSCPFQQNECRPLALPEARDRLELLGVGQLILSTNQVKAIARTQPWLQEEATFSPWTVFRIDPQPPLVQILDAPAIPIDDPYWSGRFSGRPSNYLTRVKELTGPIEPADWRAMLYYWLVDYRRGKPFILLPKIGGNAPDITVQPGTATDCHPRVVADVNRLELETDCPGQPHLLKFAYHPSWSTNTGDRIDLISPGLMLIVPSASKVSFTFGTSRLWDAGLAISIVAAAAGIWRSLRARRQRTR